MIKKIIQKEKVRQEELEKRMRNAFKPGMGQREERSKTLALQEQHKQSLINLKEYMEEILKVADDCINIGQLEADIQELTKMIERYE